MRNPAVAAVKLNQKERVKQKRRRKPNVRNSDCPHSTSVIGVDVFLQRIDDDDDESGSDFQPSGSDSDGSEDYSDGSEVDDSDDGNSHPSHRYWHHLIPLFACLLIGRASDVSSAEEEEEDGEGDDWDTLDKKAAQSDRESNRRDEEEDARFKPKPKTKAQSSSSKPRAPPAKKPAGGAGAKAGTPKGAGMGAGKPVGKPLGGAPKPGLPKRK
jgi:hypothetical protein